jgi:hypothetical protein
LPEPKHYTRASVEPIYAHLFRTGIFRVAEADGRIVSICSAIVRDKLWFLSMFWALPEFQQNKIGGPLLTQVWEEGRRHGAEIDFTWSSIDFPALGVYMKRGMLPVCQIFTLAGAPTTAPSVPSGYALEPLEPAFASRLDALVRGTSREVDHTFWRAQAGRLCQVRAAREIVGYFRVEGGAIGPAAWTESVHAAPVLALAIAQAKRDAAEIRLVAPGVNHSALALALQIGLKLVGSAHLLSSRPFGALERYLPSGPAVF